MIGEWLRKFHAADIRWSERYLVRTPLHPGFWVRRRLSAAMTAECRRARGVLLDVGCGQKPYAPLFAPHITRYIGMEYAPGAGYRGNAADVCGDAAAIQTALDQLTAAQHKAAEALYRQQAPGGQGSQDSQGAQGSQDSQGSQDAQGAPKGDVIDAEVVDEGKQ